MIAADLREKKRSVVVYLRPVESRPLVADEVARRGVDTPGKAVRSRMERTLRECAVPLDGDVVRSLVESPRDSVRPRRCSARSGHGALGNRIWDCRAEDVSLENAASRLRDVRRTLRASLRRKSALETGETGDGHRQSARADVRIDSVKPFDGLVADVGESRTPCVLRVVRERARVEMRSAHRLAVPAVHRPVDAHRGVVDSGRRALADENAVRREGCAGVHLQSGRRIRIVRVAHRKSGIALVLRLGLERAAVLHLDNGVADVGAVIDVAGIEIAGSRADRHAAAVHNEKRTGIVVRIAVVVPGVEVAHRQRRAVLDDQFGRLGRRLGSVAARKIDVACGGEIASLDVKHGRRLLFLAADDQVSVERHRLAGAVRHDRTVENRRIG